MATTVFWSHETRLPACPVSACEARSFVGIHLTQHDLGYLVDDIRLVVSELVTNALVHARTPLTVTLQELLFCVVLTVHDDSPDLPTVLLSQLGDVGGRGLDLVARYSSDWGVSLGADGDKNVWASFAVRPVTARGEEVPPNWPCDCDDCR
jgi:anti-sigma regulatory factor (Ser/Thr protein kinase)